jgi:lysophospholipase L1-like esterase
MVRLVSRFVALGDSLTEGVGDPHPRCPNGFRGWADLLAARLAAGDPATDYANLALRAKRVADVAVEQVDPAIGMRPDLVTVWAGGNDLLRPVLRLDDVLDPLDQAVGRLAGTRARVVVLTGWAPVMSLVLRPVRARVAAFDREVRGIADRHGATLLDLASLAGWSHPTRWSADRVHPSPTGHAGIADALGTLLGLPPTHRTAGAEAPESSRDGIRRWRDEGTWWFEHAAPHVLRWVAGASSREQVRPKWPEPVRPASAFGWDGDLAPAHSPAEVA